MKEENKKNSGGTGAASGEAAGPLFSAFRPAAQAEPAKAGAQPSGGENPPALETRLAGMEKKLQEAAEKESARGPEKEMLEYLKVKTGELETKLRDAQEKALAFAYELKGREEARKESRRETGDLLAAVKKQQETAEAEQQHAIELRKSRERIETLETRLTELTSKPPAPDAGLVARLEELAGKTEALSARLDAASGLPARIEELTGKIEAVPGAIQPVADQLKTAFVRIEAVTARLDAVVKAGLPPEEAEKIRTLLRHDLADTLGPLVKRLETNLHTASEHALDMRIEHEFSELKMSKEELKLLMDSVDKSAGGLAEILSGRVAELREMLSGLSSETAAADAGAEKAVEWLKSLMKEKGRAAADPVTGAYDVGFLQASLDNLEKCVSSALDTLAHAQAGGEEPPGPADLKLELLKRRHVSDLEAAIRSLKDGLAAFHGIRPELMRNMKKKLTGE